VGETIGGATVVAVIPSSQTLAFDDTYSIPCGASVYYQVYAYRYATDGPNGNNYNVARGRAYNESSFASASASIAAAPDITQVDKDDASCENANGTITITATGGNPPLEYSINGGASWQSSPVFLGLAPGSYTVLVRDAYLCETPYASNPVEIANIPSPVAPASAASDRDNFCTDDPGNIILTASGGSGLALEWFEGSCGGTPIGTGNDLTIPSPAATTTYYVRWTSTLCGNSACASVTVTVIPLPSASDAGPDQSLCGLLTTTLAANNPASGSGTWSQVSGPGSSTFANPGQFNSQVTATAYGDYIYRWTISTGGACPESFDEVAVSYGLAITVTAASNSPVCTGDTIFLTSSVAGATYSWTGPAGFTSSLQNPFIPNAGLAQEGTYTVTVSNIPNGCPNTTGSTDVDMIESPVAPSSVAASPSEICEGFTGTITLTATGGSGTEVFWYSDACDGTVVATGVTATVPAPATSTNYFAAWSRPECGVSDCAFTTVTVLDPPTASNAGPDQSLCGVLSTILDGNDPDNGTGTWTAVSGPGAVTFANPSAWNSQVDVTVNGVYVVRWTISNGGVCPESADEVTLTFDDALQVQVSSNAPLCSGLDLQLNSSIAGATYSWTGPNGFTSAEQNPVIANAQPVHSGTYTVTVSGIPGGCPNTTNSTDVVVNQSVSDLASVSASLTSICSDYTGDITLTATGGFGLALEWYEGSCGGPLAGTGAVLVIPVPPAGSTTYFARWVSASCGSTPCLSVTLTVEDPPTIAAAGPDQSICNNLATLLEGNAPASGTGTWTVVSGPGSVSFSGVNDPGSSMTVSLMGDYVVRWTISTGTLCPDSFDEVAVEFDDQIDVSASSNSPVCEGENITLYSSIAGATYSWTGPNGYVSSAQNPVIASATAAMSGDYTILVTDIPGGCPSSTATISVAVNALPAAPVILSQGGNATTQEVCQGDVVQYSVEGPLPGSGYAWTLSGGGTLIPGADPSVVEVEWTATGGTYDLSVAETSLAGCTGPAATVAVSVMPAASPQITVTASQNPVCAGDPVSFNAQATDAGNAPAYQWLLNGAPAGGNTAVFVLDTPADGDRVSCTVTSSLTCADPQAVGSAEIVLSVTEAQAVNITPGGPLCSGIPTVVSPGTGFVSYLWSDGSTTASITVEEAGAYWVQTTDAAGCVGSDTIIVEPCEEFRVFIPNAFTPNFDGDNDRFNAVFSNPGGIADYRLEIYNKWGQMIFRNDDPGEGWDGTAEGKACPSDVYSYLLRFTQDGPAGSETSVRAGTVMLVR
jgi:gliding motility-associated-like protein